MTKSDRLPHLRFDAAHAIKARADASILCARTGEGMETFYKCLDAAVAKVTAESRLVP